MSPKAIIVAVIVVVAGLFGLFLALTLGKGEFVYVPDEAVRARERGEFMLQKRDSISDRTQKAELLDQAIAEFKKAIEIKPDFNVAYNLLGKSYIEKGQLDTALQYLNKALELRKDYPAALYNRGRVYQLLSHSKRDQTYLDKAIADFLIALDSKLAATFKGDIRKSLSDAYRDKGNLSKAIEQLAMYLIESPKAEDAVLVERKIRGLALIQQSKNPNSGIYVPD
jgi:tetratricopeptide (TPR) repeat protein